VKNFKWLVLLVFYFLIQCSAGEKPTVPTTCPSDLEQKLLEKVQAYRNSLQTGSSVLDPVLRRAALTQARHLASQDRLEHSDDQGRGPMQRLNEMGINRSRVGENIGRAEVKDGSGGSTILNSWISGSREKKNLENRLFSRIGLAVSSSDNYCYAVLLMSD